MMNVDNDLHCSFSFEAEQFEANLRQRNGKRIYA